MNGIFDYGIIRKSITFTFLSPRCSSELYTLVFLGSKVNGLAFCFALCLFLFFLWVCVCFCFVIVVCFCFFCFCYATFFPMLDSSLIRAYVTTLYIIGLQNDQH